MDETKIVTFPGSPFRLHQPFPPAGDQPEAIRLLVEGIDDGLMFQTRWGDRLGQDLHTMANVIASLWPPGAGAGAQQDAGRAALRGVRSSCRRMRLSFVSYYDYYQPEAYVPSRDLFIEKDSINEHIEQTACRPPRAPGAARRVVIVASVSCIYGIGDPVELSQHGAASARGRKWPIALIQRLVAMQYNPRRPGFSPRHLQGAGRRGRCFRPRTPARGAVEMFDDEIEHLTPVRSADRAPKQKLVRFTVSVESLRDAAGDRAGGHRTHQGGAARTHRALPARSGKLVEAQRIEQRTRFDLEMLNELGFCKGIENYSRHLSGRGQGEPPPTLIDYLPSDGLMFIDESHVRSVRSARCTRATVRARRTSSSTASPSAMDNRPLKFDEFECLLPQTIFVSATPRATRRSIRAGGGAIGAPHRLDRPGDRDSPRNHAGRRSARGAWAADRRG